VLRLDRLDLRLDRLGFSLYLGEVRLPSLALGVVCLGRGEGVEFDGARAVLGGVLRAFGVGESRLELRRWMIGRGEASGESPNGEFDFGVFSPPRRRRRPPAISRT
tara:strand:- start:13 stop:330 length:318 start_codon:yes stop_codon:yes gene_type:complete